MEEELQIKVRNLITHREKCIGGIMPEKIDGKVAITVKPSKDPVIFYAEELLKILNQIEE